MVQTVLFNLEQLGAIQKEWNILCQHKCFGHNQLKVRQSLLFLTKNTHTHTHTQTDRRNW